MCWQLSMVSLPASYDVARPPRNGRDSKTRTECPTPPRAAAADRPAKPPPMTITSGIHIRIAKRESANRDARAMAAAPVAIDDLENKPNNDGDKKDVARFQCHKISSSSMPEVREP